MKNQSIIKKFRSLFTNRIGYICILLGGFAGAYISVNLFRTVHFVIPAMYNANGLTLYPILLSFVSLGFVVYSGIMTFGEFKELTGSKAQAFAYMIGLECTVVLNPDLMTAQWGVAIQAVLNTIAFAYRLYEAMPVPKAVEVAPADKKRSQAKSKAKKAIRKTVSAENRELEIDFSGVETATIEALTPATATA